MPSIEFFSTLVDLVTPFALLVAALGVALGIVLGALPGVSSTMALAILLPVSFTMDQSIAIVFLLAVFVASVYGGSVSAILINIPGTPAAIVTQFDGYPMSRSGRSGEALAYSLFSSTVGGLLGLAILVMAAPVLVSVAMEFKSPEFAMIAAFGLVLLAFSSNGSTIKGIIVGAIGLIAGMVGFDMMTDVERFTFGGSALQGGIDVVPLTVGLFGLAEVLKNVSNSSNQNLSIPKITRILPPLKKLLSTWKSMIRGSFVGAFVGAMPAAGSAVAVAIAYANEVKLSKQPEKFGTGCEEGIVAPESANSAGVGGSLIPMMTLGIPGDTITAVLMGALLIHGLRPGPMLFTNNPEFVTGVYAALFIALIFTLVIGLLSLRCITAVMRIPTRVMMVLIALLCIVGAFSIRNSIVDVYVMVFFGCLGYVMNLLKIPVAPLAFGLILGPMLEENLRRTLMISQGSWEVFIDRPISLALLIAIILFIAAPFIKPLIKSIGGRKTYKKKYS